MRDDLFKNIRDKLINAKFTRNIIMLMLLLVVFWITIVGANYPSQLLSQGFSWIEGKLVAGAVYLNAPTFAYEFIIFGVYRVSTWVIAVVLPPMLVFFPLFTLLEECGYLPRVAYNLDGCFRKCHACGQQAITTCMGFGCNAVGVTGCQMIESPRERMIAILTNSFVPCNGRFPMLIAVITMFIACENSFIAAITLTMLIVGSVGMTLIVSYILSKTVLKGIPSSVSLVLTPLKIPDFKHVILYSIFDRLIFVLRRSLVVAAPAGGVIWLISNLTWQGESIIVVLADLLEPVGAIMGLDGVILLAFILGMPANELVLPLMFMIYVQTNRLSEIGDLTQIRTLFVDNGWTLQTAVNVMIFSVMHWPCATTLLTIKNETKSWRWTMCAFALPTVCGIVICMMTNLLSNLV